MAWSKLGRHASGAITVISVVLRITGTDDLVLEALGIGSMTPYAVGFIMDAASALFVTCIVLEIANSAKQGNLKRAWRAIFRRRERERLIVVRNSERVGVSAQYEVEL